MSNRKFFFALIATAALLAVGGVWLAQGVHDVGLWGLWFAGLNGVVGLYSAANVVQKNIVSKNYRPELDK